MAGVVVLWHKGLKPASSGLRVQRLQLRVPARYESEPWLARYCFAESLALQPQLDDLMRYCWQPALDAADAMLTKANASGSGPRPLRRARRRRR